MEESHPYLIEDLQVKGKKLKPLPKNNKVFQEDWLQQLLYTHPDILPMGQIGEEFKQSISIGREILKIDNLYVSPSGLLTIVETKLWRNPEAHRTVIAQILEYAKQISTLNYNQLDDAVKKSIERIEGKPKSIYERIKGRLKDCTEIEFQQRIQDCLDNGKYALLIVGDRIYPGATQLAEVIQSAPHMQYTIAFVELSCFRLTDNADWPMVVIPKVVTKTKEITRAVVKVIYEKEKPHIKITTPTDKTSISNRTSPQEFIALLPKNISDLFKNYIEHWRQKGYTIYWGQAGFSLKINWYNKACSILQAFPSYVIINKGNNLQRTKLPPKAYSEYKKQLMTSYLFSTALAQEKSHIKYTEMNENDISLLLDATDKLAEKLSGAFTGFPPAQE